MQKYAILIFFVIKEHQFSRNVLDEDNLNKSDALKTLSAYYGMFNKLLKMFILLEDSINRSENFDEIVGKDLNDLPRIKCPYSELFWSAFSRIRTKCREILGTGIIPNTDTFHAVIFVLRIVENLMILRKLEIKNFQIKSSTTKTKRLSQQTIVFFYTGMINFPNGDFSISTFTTMVLYKLSIDK